MVTRQNGSGENGRPTNKLVQTNWRGQNGKDFHSIQVVCVIQVRSHTDSTEHKGVEEYAGLLENLTASDGVIEL